MKICTKCQQEKDDSEFKQRRVCTSCFYQINRERYYLKREQYLAQKKEYGNRPEVREKRRQQQQENYIKNRKVIIEKAAVYRKERLKIDEDYALICTLKTRTNHTLKHGANISPYIKSILGNDYLQIMLHLAAKFRERYKYDFPGFDGNYVIHHIIPISSYKNKEELIALFHYTNIEILTKEDHKQVHSRREGHGTHL